MKGNPPTLRFYTGDDCHLCHEALNVVRAVARKMDFTLEIIDISSDPELEEQFREKIPMLYINDRAAFKYRVNERSLRRKLKAASLS